jgi:hypothetical protein
MSDERIEQMVLYAWVGEDELGSGEVGLKQALVPAGMIPMVACKLSKVDEPYIVAQLREQARVYGKTIRLCRFVYAGEALVLEP